MQKIVICITLSLMIAGCKPSLQGELLFVEPAREDGFNFPYFLFIPDNITGNNETILIIEPNNSGFVDDDLHKHVEKAERTATIDFYLGNYVARQLQSPLLVPVFPRSRSDWNVYTHALDRDVMIQRGNSLERIDLQLIEMFKDARSRLREINVIVKKEFLMTGFSASGSFVNRFTAIHPERVLAAAAGGLNGLLILPLDSLKGEELNFPLGTNDFKELFGKTFQMDLLKETPQFYFMGALDDNDAIPYDDAYDLEEREIVYQVMGKNMLPDRWEFCRKIYRENNINAKIKTFSGTGHEQTEQVKEEVTAFFRDILNKGISSGNN